MSEATLSLLPRKSSHDSKAVGPFSDPNSPPCIKKVERMGKLEQVIIRRDRKTFRQHPPRLFIIEVKSHALLLNVGLVEVVSTHLVFVLEEEFSVGYPSLCVLYVLEVGNPLEGHHDPLHAISDLNCWRIEGLAARLLKVGELSHLHTIQPHFPTQPPCSKDGALPVVLHESNIMGLGVNPKGLEGPQVELLTVARVGLQDHLELGVALEAVGVVSVSGIVGADGGLCIAYIPWLGSQDSEECGRVHGACSHLSVVWEPDCASD